MNSLVLFVACIAVLGVCINAAPVDQTTAAEHHHCPVETLSGCAFGFAQEIGLDFFPSSVITFQAYFFKRMFQEGKAYFAEFCHAYENFAKCLGPSAGQCMTVDALAHLMGTSFIDATLYASFYWQFESECGADYQILYDHFNCFGDVISNHSQALQACANAFVQSISMPSDLPKFCQYVSALKSCVLDIYASSCGAEVTAALATSVNTAYDYFVFPQCKNHKFDHGKIAGAAYGVESESLVFPNTVRPVLGVIYPHNF